MEQNVAVKIINVEICGADKSVLAECATLRNVVTAISSRLLQHCSGTDFKGNNFKALVFEFMPNGSLDNWLYPCSSYQGNERNLTLLQRLKIWIDVAVGMDYLHHHKFSFGTTCGINQGQMSSIGVCGTVGYIPPEYEMGGKISTQGDVYSYGIFLLEMFSGIQPTSSSIFLDSANNLHDYVRKALQQRVLDITDPRFVRDQEYRDLSATPSYSRAMMRWGILCSVETPRERIDISLAVKQLTVARDRLLRCTQGQ
ncbi:putative LRR receptor-like serine/threonine-protein kinase At3g47570 [Apium graveolens]|uniref:putative LRR receptor-like serine/threonine-protein kinase At3g47570 n=1 Tax=Apium graveolens TaxID=4045 RepID=UPI003D7BAAA4